MFPPKVTKNCKWLCVFASIACTIGVFFGLGPIFGGGKSEFDKNIYKRTERYFCVTPVIPLKNIPLIKAEIDGIAFKMLLDLGFTGHLCLRSKPAEKISTKKAIGTSQIYNHTGRAHPTNLYSVSKVSIAGASWPNPVLQQCNDEFIYETIISKESATPKIGYDGIFGWPLFHSMNLLLDLGNFQVACCDSIETLQEKGYAVNTWVKTPLFLDKGLIEIEATTPEGLTRCLLDTGCSWCEICTDLEYKSLQEAFFNPNNRVEYSCFKIEETDFGPIVFRPHPSKFHIFTPVILGMHFLVQHQIFIDFKRGFVYFSPPSNAQPKPKD